MILAIYPPSYNSEDESIVSLITFRTDYIFSEVSPKDKFFYYFSGGIGICIFRETSYNNYLFVNDTLRETHNNRSKNLGSLLFAFGVSAGYKISKNTGIQAQIEYNFITGEKVTERISFGFIPFKIGMFFVL